MDNILAATLLLPLFSASLLFIIMYSNPLEQKFYTFITLSSIGLSTLFALSVVYENYVHSHTIYINLFTWLHVEDFSISLALKADNLSSIMLLFVSPVSFLIHIYATGYMNKDRSYARFFALFNLFLFFMLLLILADNPIVMFMGWEGVGLCSYALIGFYFNDLANMHAANKAFIVNRIGDFGLLSGILLLFVFIGHDGFSFSELSLHFNELSSTQVELIAFLLFFGAMGKSAQIPLYVWLPDAMAGPTPVSALIHAATMVTAGVYLVARYSELFILAENTSLFIAYIGAFSALFAAIIATRQNDIKKILAYSTMSQLGYMFLAAGLGAYSLAIFHVFVHAFFKALLFMGAGAIITAMHHEQNIFKMGGLKSKLPALFYMLIIATLALSAIPPLSGFFSKDAIMAHTFASSHIDLYIIALITAGLTAFYMFRLIFMVFYGEESSSKLQSLPKSMMYPMLILTFFTLITGAINIPHLFGGNMLLSEYLALCDKIPFITHTTEYGLIAINLIVVVSSIYFAYSRYAKRAASRKDMNLGALSRFIENKFYVDELYQRIFVTPILILSRTLDKRIDHYIIDNFILLISKKYVSLGELSQQLTNANVRYYALYIVIGISMLSLYLLYTLEF